MAKFGWAIGIFLLLLIGSLLTYSLTTLTNTHFTNLKQTTGFQYQSRERDVRFSKHGCTGHWSQRETFYTNKSRRYLWDRLSEMWGPKPGDYSLLQEEAIYIEDQLQAMKIQSKISYDSYPHSYTVHVTNELALQFPTRMCEAGINIAQLGR